MSKFYNTLLLVFVSIAILSAQKITWADEVVSFSSEYQDAYRYYSSYQILGVPNAIGPEDLSPWAWVPKKPDAGSEHIRVRFKNAQKGIRQVYVSESHVPGAITKISLFDNKGKKHVVYENKDPKPLRTTPYRMFKTSFSPTNYYVKECLVELNTKKVPGHNHLDAIGITDHHGEIKIKGLIDDLQYARPVPPPENLGRSVNSNFAERLPIISPDGNTLYFTRKWHPDNVGAREKDGRIESQDDIWVSQRKGNNQWSHAVNIDSPLNDERHNFVIAVNPTGTNIYLGNDYQNRSNKDGVSISSGGRGMWGKPRALKIQDHYNDNVFVEYHMSVDEKILLLSVERTEGYGERDLYVSFKQGKGWSKPKNLGRDINTVNIESSVFLAADGKTLYFSSNGHYTYGGLDVFMSKRLDDSWTKWSKPKNLGPKINTPENDFNYTIPASGEYAYFSSSYDSYGMSDLFRILLPQEARPEPVMLMSGQIIDVTTNKPIQAKLKYNSLPKKKDEKPTTPEEENIAEADDDGSYQVILPYGENVEVYADIEGYFPVSESMELSDDNLEELDSDNPDDPLLVFDDAPPSEEEKKLENELVRLEQELAALKKKKQERPEPKKYITAYDYDKPQGVVTNPSARPKPKPKVGKDSELDYLKKKYYNKLYGSDDEPEDTPPSDTVASTPRKNNKPKPKPADKNNKEVKSMYDKLYGNKDKDEPKEKEVAETERPQEVVDDMDDNEEDDNEPIAQNKPRPKPNPADKNGDEVQSMYDKLYGNKNKDKEPSDSDVVEDKPVSNPSDDPFYVAEEEEEKPEEKETPSEDVAKEEPREENTDPFFVPEEEEDEKETPVASNRPKEDVPSFEELEEKIRQELKAELLAQIRAELRQELMDEIKKEFEREAQEKALVEEAARKLERENRKNLDSLDPVKANVEGGDIEEELKSLIIADVKEQLKEELEAPIKEELKEDVALLVKEKELEKKEEKANELKKERMENSDGPRLKDEPKKDPEYIELNQNIQVVPIKVGQVIPMNNIFFDANKSDLKDESFSELQRVLEFLKKNPNLVVEVGGHTNGWCSSSFADQLSKGRAKEVRAYFTENGIPENRIQYRGYGKRIPIADNDTLQGRKKNQRVELKILEILD